MEKYGFFGGSFNPVTKAHIELADEIVKKYGLDRVVFVPVGNCYIKEGLINEIHRYNMLKIATRNYNMLDVSDIELKQNKNLTTLEAFSKIEEKFKNIDKYFIIGEDNLYKILESKDAEMLINNYKYIVIQRESLQIDNVIKKNKEILKNKDNFFMMENKKHINTSSTKARNEMLTSSKEVEKIVDKEVLNYIKENKLYSIC